MSACRMLARVVNRPPRSLVPPDRLPLLTLSLSPSLSLSAYSSSSSSSSSLDPIACRSPTPPHPRDCINSLIRLIPLNLLRATVAPLDCHLPSSTLEFNTRAHTQSYVRPNQRTNLHRYLFTKIRSRIGDEFGIGW